MRGVARAALAARVAFAALAAPRAVAGLELDATTVARAGSALVDRIDVSPGAPQAPARLFAVDARRIDRDAEIDAMGLRAVWTRAAIAIAVRCDRVRSPVHGDAGGAVAAQLRRGDIRAGAAVELRRLHFASGATLSRARLRLGLGAGRAATAAAALIEFPSGAEPPRIALATRLEASRGLACVAEVERRTGAPTNARWALEVGADALTLWCGYETATMAAAWGGAIDCGPLRIVCAARVHPDLGWSPTWSCEWRP